MTDDKERNQMDRDTITKAIKAAVTKRNKGQRLLDEGTRELAEVTAAARQARAMPTTKMAEVAGLSREYLYQLQREHVDG